MNAAVAPKPAASPQFGIASLAVKVAGLLGLGPAAAKRLPGRVG